MARNFNGSSDNIQALSSPVTTYPMTLACWVKPTAVVSTRIYLSIGSSNGADPSRVVLGQNNETVYGGTYNSVGNSRLYFGGPAFTAGSWTHIALVFTSSSNVILYAAGVSSTTSALTRILTNIDRTVIGARTAAGTLGEHGNGDVAEAAIWNVGLNADEIASLQKFSPNQIRPQSLVFYTPLVREIIEVRGGLALTANGTTVSNHPRIIS